MRIQYILLLSISSLFAFSCNSTKRVTNLDDETERFSLSKSACFGNCPTFNLSINQDGYATLEGIANLDKLGIYGKQLSKEQFKNLELTFIKSNFDQFPALFESTMTDLPTIKIGYHNGDTFKLVSGKEDRPEQLMQLQFALERIVDSNGWILIKNQKELDQTKKPTVVRIIDEIIIEPQPGTQMVKWFESMDKYGVRLIKKIAPGLNYYLITYNKDNITGEDLIKVLKKDEHIKTAEFNKKTSKRGR